MKIEDLIELYAHSPQAKALSEALSDTSKQHITINGLAASAASVLFAAAMRRSPQTVLFVLNDADEAGYFYHDMTQLTGTSGVLFFPGSTKARLTEKNSHPDAANEILRTEAMAALTSGNDKQLCVVTYPEAIAEEVVSREHMEQVTISVKAGDECDFAKLEERLRELGFTEVDYVYEPGQFAVRGSIVDVFSYSSEYPFRIDFFDDEVDSIRTFEVDSQLSKEKRDSAELVPEMKEGSEVTTSFFKFLPKNTIVAMKNRQYTSDIVGEDFDDEVKAFRTVEFGEVRGARFEVRGARFEVRGARCEVRGARCEV
ncbi:MAG: transcription-repair coupling factor, partial [Prevotella sp.]|nr:transcription-repair coupling factor [Prevotella sp.]